MSNILSLLGDYRQPDRKAAARSRQVLHADRSAAKLNYLLSKRKAEAVAVHLARIVALVELVEYPFFVARRDPGAVVLDSECHGVIFSAHAHQDHPAVGVELYGVVDQIRPYMYQQRAVARILDLVQLNVKVDVLLRPFLLQRHDGLPHLLVKPVADALRADALRAYLGQEQDVPDERGEAAGIEEYLFNIIVLLLLRLLVILQQGSVALNGVYRRLELMRHAGDEVRLQGLGRTQLLDHHVEAAVQAAHLIDAAVCLGGHIEVPARHGAHGLFELCDGVKEYLQCEICDDEAENDAEQNRPYEERRRHGYAEPLFYKPRRQLREERDDDVLDHAYQREPDAQRRHGCKLLFHSFTTL